MTTEIKEETDEVMSSDGKLHQTPYQITPPQT